MTEETKERDQPARTWTFTEHGCNDVNLALMRKWLVNRILVGREFCPTTGKEHWQGAATFTRPMRFSAVTKLSATAHWEKAWAKDPFTYCFKDGDILVNEDNRKQGKRTDLKPIYDAVLEGKRLKDWMEETRPSLHMQNTFKAIRAVLRVSPRWRQLQVYSVYGPPGSGKSRWAFEKWLFPEELFVMRCYPGKPMTWDGYDGQKVVLFEEYRPHWTPLSIMLSYLDGYPLELPARYQNVWAQYTIVVLTSVTPVVDMWSAITDEPMEQLKRRITRTLHVTEVASVILDDATSRSAPEAPPI
nr:MAG: replication associated protein [Cressdnaviricota sp.]